MVVKTTVHPVAFGLFFSYHNVKGEKYLDLFIPFLLVSLKWGAK